MNSSTGSGLTGLLYNAAGLKAYYRLQPTGAFTQISLATQTYNGAYSSGGFVEIDATNAPGFYRLDVPNAVFSAEGKVSISISGATNLSPCPIEIQVGGSPIKSGVSKNVAIAKFPFNMVTSSDGVTAATGKTVTAQRSIDGAAFGACANSPAELSNGSYYIDLAAADLNGTTIHFKFTANGCIDRFITVITTP